MNECIAHSEEMDLWKSSIRRKDRVITVGLDFSLNENVPSYLIIFQGFNSDKSRCILYGTMRPALNCFF